MYNKHICLLKFNSYTYSTKAKNKPQQKVLE